MDWIKRFVVWIWRDKTLVCVLILLLVVFTVVSIYVMFCDSGTQVAGKWFGTLNISDGKGGKQETLRFIGWVMSGLLATIGVIMIGRRADAQIENNKISSENNRLIEKGHIEDRVRSATELLAKKQTGARIAAFYQFYYLAKDDEDENFRKNIFDILCSHLRNKTRDPKYQKNNKAKPSEEIQTLLDILFKPENKEDGKAAFRKLVPDLQRVHLAGADLSRACLPQADFSDACLIGANMENAKLHKCIFARTKMHGTNLSNAKMPLAIFDDTKLMGSNLFEADMRGSTLKNTVDLRAACVSYLRMQGVTFDGIIDSIRKGLGFQQSWQSTDSWYCVRAGGVYSAYFDASDYSFRVLNQANTIGDASSIHFSYNSDTLKDEIDNTIKFLREYVDKQAGADYQERLQERTPKHPKKMTEEDVENRMYLNPYKEEDAKEWIAEYNEVMKPTPETENK